MERLYTWMDVEAVILKARYAGKWPDGVSFQVYTDTVEVHLTDGRLRNDAQTALEEWFGSRYSRSDGKIFLESPPNRHRVMDVDFIGDDEVGGRKPVRHRPTFAHITLLPRVNFGLPVPEPPQLPDNTPPVIAFYSFKGGVGRTTHLVALVKAYTEKYSHHRRPLLIVDADVEAPGLTWWVRDLVGPAEVSFLDFLALAQYDESDGFQDTLQLVSRHIRQQPVFIETPKGRAEHYFLPAFRDIDQGMRMPLRPEHVVQVPRREWAIVDLLARLGRDLGASGVVVDLRAGFSEISSPFLFDPRVRRVLVTGTSSQAVDGTRAVLQQIRKVMPYHVSPDTGATSSEYFDPVVIISLVPPQREHVSETVREQLLQEYPNPEEIEAEEERTTSDRESVHESRVSYGDLVSPPRLRIEDTRFAEELLHLDSLQAAWDRLSGTSVLAAMDRFAGEWLAEPEGDQDTHRPPVRSAEELKSLRRRLAETAGRLVAAESGEGEDFLRTASLEKLGRRYQFDLPLAIVMGAKGAGKTFVFLQMLRRRTWATFLSVLGIPTSDAQGLMLPLLEPLNLEPQASSLVNECRQDTLARLGWHHGGSARSVVIDKIRAFLREADTDESQWRRYWVRLIGETLGLTLNPDHPEKELQQVLKQRGAHVVVVMDGLEDLFQSLPRDPRQQVALRALCQDLPTALREIPDRRLGLVVFVRKDLVRAAVRQNFSQFESLHKSYELRWNPEEALRLAVWLCQKAGNDLDLQGHLLEEAPRDVLEQALYRIWGYKLGAPRSREAVTANWVLAALSDFAGRLQARDVVRFFHYAAKRAQVVSEYDGRLLQPAAVRYAIEPCSQDKVKEAQEEMPWLADIFEKFNRVPDRRIPFRAGDYDLTAEDVRLMNEVGIIFEEEGVFYMPEIYRHGLGFKLEKGARPKVLSLMKRAFGTL